MLNYFSVLHNNLLETRSTQAWSNRRGIVSLVASRTFLVYLIKAPISRVSLLIYKKML